MGTNFYMMTRNKELARNYFAQVDDWGVTDEEYTVVDEPFLGYRIHLNKLSCGWRPLFQRHKAFKSWKELERFYYNHIDDLFVFDEYGDAYSFNKYKERDFGHLDVEPRPLKWVFDVDPIDSRFQEHPRKTIHLEECEPEEAEIWTPFDHILYFEMELAARRRWSECAPWFDDLRYWRDPDFNFDWTEGEFS